MKNYIAILLVLVIVYLILTKSKTSGNAKSNRSMNKKVLIFTDSIKTNKDAFIKEVEALSDRLGIDPNWLMGVMWKESRLISTAVNKDSNATGLIQFMPSTAIGLGTTTDKLYNMSNVNQLYYVEKYFQSYKNKINSFLDLYLVTFFPIALNHDDKWFFQTKNLSAEKIGLQNSGINGGKPINKIAFKNYLLKSVPTQYQKILA